MAEMTAEIIHQLEMAQARLGTGTLQAPALAPVAAAGPAVVTGTAGGGTVQYVLVDHDPGGAFRRLWAYCANAWHYRDVTNADEQGIAQVAYAANRVDAYWDANDQITLLRCWKNF